MAGAMAVVTAPVRLVWRLPGWRRRWRRRRLGAVMTESRTRLERVRALGLGGTVVRGFRRDAVRAAAARLRVQYGVYIVLGPLAAAFGVAYIVLRRVVDSWYAEPLGSAGSAASVLVAILITASVGVPQWTAHRLGLPDPRPVPVATAVLTMSLVLFWWARWPGAHASSDVSHGVALASGLWLCGLALLVPAVSLAAWAGNLLLRSRDAVFTEAVVVNELLAALARVPDEATWRDGAQRRDAADCLERAAVVVEHALPERLACDDPTTAAAVRQRCRRVAAAFREQELSVLLPGPGTPDAFREFVVAAATAVATGRLDDLPTADPPPGRTRRDVAAGLARTAVIASLPAAVFGVLQASAAAVDGAAAGSVTALCLAWAVLTVIAALDPLFRDKVAAVKEAAGLLRP